MATFKLEVQKEFGRFQHRVVSPAVSDPTPDWSAPVADRDALIKDIGRNLEGVAFGDGDTVIFRSIAYDNAAELTNTIRFNQF